MAVLQLVWMWFSCFFLLSAKPDSLQLLNHSEHFWGRRAVNSSNLALLGEEGRQFTRIWLFWGRRVINSSIALRSKVLSYYLTFLLLTSPFSYQFPYLSPTPFSYFSTSNFSCFRASEVTTQVILLLFSNLSLTFSITPTLWLFKFKLQLHSSLWAVNAGNSLTFLVLFNYLSLTVQLPLSLTFQIQTSVAF